MSLGAGERAVVIIIQLWTGARKVNVQLFSLLAHGTNHLNGFSFVFPLVQRGHVDPGNPAPVWQGSKLGTRHLLRASNGLLLGRLYELKSELFDEP